MQKIVRKGAMALLAAFGFWASPWAGVQPAVSGPKAAVATGNVTPKVALVIGNGAYSQGGYQLKNPANDAELMTQTLTKLGFEVRKELNLGRSNMLRAVAEFSAAVPEGATAFVYFAGHGMQIGGASYLIPADMEITSEAKVPLRAVALSAVLDGLASSRSAVNVIVLDACRNNPFAGGGGPRYRGGVPWGLAGVKAPRGTLVAYSTAPNQLAPDGTEANSLYTKALASMLLQPNTSLVDTFTRVGEQVRKRTYDDQIPWFSTSLVDDYYFLPPDGTTVVAGKSLARPKNQSNTVVMRGGQGTVSSPAWYRSLSEQEWSQLDWEIGQRVKRLTADELPALEHLAKGGSVVAQTTLGIAWREGIQRVSGGGSTVARYGANNSYALKWLNKAAEAGFGVAQVELAEMYYMGHGVARNLQRSRDLFARAAESHYPRAQLGLAELKLQSGEGSPQELMNAMGAAWLSIPKPTAGAQK